MIQRETMYVQSAKRIAKDTVEMVLKNSHFSNLVTPGQFLYIQLAHHLLRRPISIADVNKEEGTVTIIFKQVGSGTKELANIPAGTKLDAIGPNGNGFPTEAAEGDTVLLVGGGIGIPPLYYLGKALRRKGAKVISLLGFQSKEQIFYEESFLQLGEALIVTDDGSYGEKGYVTDVLDQVKGFDRYYTCGPTPMLKAVTEQLSSFPGFISLEERMGCGIGACFACTVPTNAEKGYKRICSDGPVFSAGEVLL